MSIEHLHGVAVSQVGDTRWHVHRLDGIEPMAGPPEVVLDREGDGFRVSRQGQPKTTHIEGSFEQVVRKIAVSILRIEDDKQHRMMVNFYESMLRSCNVLACKQNQLPALMLALANTLGDTLHEDVKPDGLAEVARMFNQAVQSRMEMRRSHSKVADAVGALFDSILSDLKPDDDKPEADAPDTKH